MSAEEITLTESQGRRILAGLQQPIPEANQADVKEQSTDVPEMSAHLSPETIQAYAEERLTDAAELGQVESHLFDCDACLALYNTAFDASSPLKSDFDAFHARLPVALEALEKSRLARALEHLAAASTDLRERLLRWRDQVLATEARVGAAVTAFLQPGGQSSFLQGLADLSAPGFEAVLVGATRTTLRGEGGSAEVGNRIVVAVDEWLDVEVVVTADSVLLDFANWSGAAMPLVMLLPEEADVEETVEVLLADPVPGEEGAYRAQFDNVPAGSYLLSIAPPLS